MGVHRSIGKKLSKTYVYHNALHSKINSFEPDGTPLQGSFCCLGIRKGIGHNAESSVIAEIVPVKDNGAAVRVF